MSHKFTLVIKGNAIVAHESAGKRGFEGLRTISASGATECTVLSGEHYDSTAAHRWLGEPGSAPYPTGSLLHFSYSAEVQ